MIRVKGKLVFIYGVFTAAYRQHDKVNQISWHVPLSGFIATRLVSLDAPGCAWFRAYADGSEGVYGPPGYAGNSLVTTVGQYVVDTDSRGSRYMIITAAGSRNPIYLHMDMYIRICIYVYIYIDVFICS